MLSQRKMIQEHLRIHGSITSWEAIDIYGASRLSAIIHRLRHKYGWTIRNEWFYTRKHWWSFRKTRFVKYILVKGK